jgi:DNA invertase Pin-like site-specific DNA recombinase
LPPRAEFEWGIIKERTKAGLEAAKARGRIGGRPGGMSPAAIEKAKSAKLLYDSGTKTGEIAKLLGISRATCYRYIGYAAKLG